VYSATGPARIERARASHEPAGTAIVCRHLADGENTATRVRDTRVMGLEVSTRHQTDAVPTMLKK
jgi:hypothetical protein